MYLCLRKTKVQTMLEFVKPRRLPQGLQATIRKLPIRQGMVVSMEDYKRSSVTNAASLAGREVNGHFSVHCDWEGRKFIIRREA